MEDFTKVTRCIDLTDADKTEGYGKFEANQSSSVQVVPNLII